MMYILTQEEYDALRAEQKREIALSKKKLQTLCTHICNTMPVDWGWGKKGDPEYFKPWRCVLTEEHEWYCDSCPVQEICPSNEKTWSKMKSLLLRIAEQLRLRTKKPAVKLTGVHAIAQQMSIDNEKKMRRDAGYND